MKRNPQRICEYCKLLARKYAFSTGRAEKRRTLARFKLHKKAVHTNPPPKKRLQAAMAIARKIHAHFKNKGVPAFVMRAVPDNYRSIVTQILKVNGVPVRA